MDKNDLIKLLDDKSDKYGNLLIDCMERYHKINLNELTYEELLEYCIIEGLIEQGQLDKEKEND